MSEATDALTGKETELILHALGLGAYGCGKRRRWSYRNYFTACPTSGDGAVWAGLAERGLAQETALYDSGYRLFRVTRAGIALLPVKLRRRIRGEDVKA